MNEMSLELRSGELAAAARGGRRAREGGQRTHRARASQAEAQRVREREQHVGQQHGRHQPRQAARASLQGLGESLLLFLVAEQVRRPGETTLSFTYASAEPDVDDDDSEKAWIYKAFLSIKTYKF